MLFDTHTNLMWYPDHFSDEFVETAWEAKRAKMKLSKDVYFAGSDVKYQNAFDSRPEQLLEATKDADKVIVFGIKAPFCGINADQELIAHGYAADGRDAAKKAFLAGMDMAMQSDLFNKWLPDLVEKGEVPMERLDEAVRRVLHLKEALGLFDNPYRSIREGAERRAVGQPATLALAREAGGRSIVLLRNESNLLPLAPSPGRIALIGPFGADRQNLVGPWAFMADPSLSVSVEQALKSRKLDVTVVEGCGIETAIPGGIEQAVAAAKGADIVILALGESQIMSGEAQSRTEIGLPAPQQALAEAVANLGKPVIVLLRHGRALALEGAVRSAPAILATWFPGSRTGEAIADILFGDVNPSAKLAVSFPRESGQQPFFYNHKSTGRPAPGEQPVMFKARYRETANVALFPFGHGLSYTTFEIGELSVPARMTNRIEISAVVRNTGKRAGEEVVQLYIHDEVASRTRPVRELKGFRKVALAPGEQAKVNFTLTKADLAFWSEGVMRSEPGAFRVWLGNSSVSGESRVFELT